MSTSDITAEPLRSWPQLLGRFNVPVGMLLVCIPCGGAAIYGFSAGFYSLAATAAACSFMLLTTAIVLIVSGIAGARRFRESLRLVEEQRRAWDAKQAEYREERAQADQRYRQRIAEAEAMIRASLPMPEPVVDPEVVVDRVNDLGLDVSAKVEPDGAVVVTLRRLEPAGSL